jgi:predicted transcriptional regulator
MVFHSRPLWEGYPGDNSSAWLVRSCNIHDAAIAPAAVMWEHDCGMVPIVDDEGRLAGVVTDRDICMAAYLQGHGLAEIPIASFMAPRVATCRPDDEVVWAEHLMSQRVGDLARVAPLSPTRRPCGELGPDLLQTMAAISQPRS